MPRKVSESVKNRKRVALSKRRMKLEENMHSLERKERSAVDAIEWKAHQALAKVRKAFNKRKDSLRVQYDKVVSSLDSLRG